MYWRHCPHAPRPPSRLYGWPGRNAYIVNLSQNASQVVETVMDEIGHQTLEMLLALNAEQVAGARTPGKASGAIHHHGSQAGCVQLADCKVQVKRPRLRHKNRGRGEDSGLRNAPQGPRARQHMRGALMRGVSTREYQEVLPQMAATVEISRSAISRKAIQAMKEMFTLQRLHIPDSLHKCLATTDITESPQGGVERRTQNVNSVARCGHGAALRGFRLATHGKALPPHRRACQSLVVGGHPRPADQVNQSTFEGEGSIRSVQPRYPRSITVGSAGAS